jgi:MoxR-like ATPase
MSSPASSSTLDPDRKIDAQGASKLVRALYDNLKQVAHVPDEVLLFLILCMLAEGHVIIEDLPGTGKTTLATALARSSGLDVARIQFSPDLEKADVVGSRYFDDRVGRYELRPGPIFSNIVVADEVNRASPRTQATMLECMQERQVTFGMVSYEIQRPFMVLATQNPIESLGTYELPEAQLDRFMIKLALGYPPRESERDLLLEQSAPDPLEALQPVTDKIAVRKAVGDVRLVRATEEVAEYVVSLLEATRADTRLKMGASPRGGIALMRMAKAYAISSGRETVSIEDVKVVAPAVLPHRLRVAEGVDLDSEVIVREHLAS